ncbi:MULTISPECIES: uroporphyrinogen-III synthase [Sphingobium]|uniref:Uroporphyrinogen-III synthase n=1 Tax=Sphingobium yanoikuyae TaxID=13690 RepID=A0A177JP27_SPHYA|nr:uroporphyrinogen-III synthase [Sphingobium yanoikuyae]OAH43119.1 uroporphyrinogen-III synthase [Sphingobium yanoikuyae]PZU58658.1 MAG: uroporphyrinogen-III synthase [Sphingobium sp.]
MRPLIILRPAPGAGRTADKAMAMGLAVRLCPLFAAEALAWTPPPAGDFDALLVTSAQTVRSGGAVLQAYRALPTYAVGAATAEALRAAGFVDPVAGDGDASAIAARIAADGHRAVLHLSGETAAPMDAGPLRVTRIPVYRMMPLPCDPLELSGGVLLVHSAAAGGRLAEILAENQRATCEVVAISPAALAACGSGWGSAQAADAPNDAAVLALARRLCE